jgi:mannosyltransferase OCH1-like enzyme
MWADQEPHGEWWSETKDLVELVLVEPPTEIFGKPITQPAHKSDVIRLQVLIENGGIYVDTEYL